MANASNQNPARGQILDWLTANLPLSRDVASELLTVPPSAEMGDYALPCFALAAEMKKAPHAIAEELAGKFTPSDEVVRAEAVGPYLNFSLNRPGVTAWVLERAHRLGPDYGKSRKGAGEMIAVDFSSPNIAKHLGVHHLRSVSIGRALYNLYSALGYECVGINHLGDWGTSFGKLIAAFERYGDLDVETATVSDLQDTYVRFSSEAEEDPELEAAAREAFRRLESGEPEATRLWERFKHISLENFEHIYRMLDVSFDTYTPESFFNDKMDATLGRIREAGITEISEGALIVPLEQYGMPPCLLRTRDGTSLYATRDICAAEYRWNTYRFHRALYVVGSEQKLYFRQIKKVLALMGYEWADRIEHVDFGLIKLKDAETGKARKGSTRRGEIVLLEDVLRDGIERAREKILQNVDHLEEGCDVEELAAQIGIGAAVFSDLCVRRNKDVIFDWDAMLDFEGDTGPYVQYAHARLYSIQRKAGEEASDKVDFARLGLPEEWSLVRRIEGFPAEVERAAEECEPSLLATYLLELCAEFSTYYSAGMRQKDRRVLCEDSETRAARLLLTDAVRHVVKSGLTLLGIKAPERM